jgi:hypothetical protein
MNSFVINGLVKRLAELAGDIEKTHEPLRKMVLDLESLDANSLRAASLRAILRYGLSREARHEGDDGHSQQGCLEPKPLMLSIGL